MPTFIDVSVNVAKSSRGKSRRSDIKGKETLRLKSNGKMQINMQIRGGNYWIHLIWCASFFIWLWLDANDGSQNLRFPDLPLLVKCEFAYEMQIMLNFSW